LRAIIASADRLQHYRVREFDARDDFALLVANVDAPFEGKSPPLTNVIGNKLPDRHTSLSPCQTNVLVISAVWIFGAIITRDKIEEK
jgi:hypothetical protein